MKSVGRDLSPTFRSRRVGDGMIQFFHRAWCSKKDVHYGWSLQGRHFLRMGEFGHADLNRYYKMSQLDIAIQTFSKAIQTGQIGTPVAARVVAHVVADHGWLQRLSVHTIEKLGRWFGGPPRRIDAMGNMESGHVSTLSSFGGGQTALVSVGTNATDRPLLEVVVWGNRGILSWQPDGVSSADATEDVEPNLSKVAAAMLQPLQASLESALRTCFEIEFMRWQGVSTSAQSWRCR